jgi:glycosyltransferase involved in cell wall biosynthesis
MLQMTQVCERAAEFDVIHSHMGVAALPYSKLIKTPMIHTLHGVFTPDNEKLFTYAKQQPYVSISNAQREERLGLNCVATVYNGIDVNQYDFYPQPQEPPYLAFLGRLSPEKGPHHAIEIAKRAGWTLKMAGKIDAIDQEFFDQQLKSHIDGQQIQYLGEANHAQKSVLMGNAVATLFPITWREPFGLVMTESMATGTPVIAMGLGSVPEIVTDGVSGFICHNIEECIAAVDKIPTISRLGCREYVLKNFGVEQMADGYEAVYQAALVEKFARNGHHRKSLVAVA